MIYLDHIIFPSEDIEYKYILDEKRTCYDTFYPFKVLSKHELRRIDFEAITILCGGNGSGKTTALNIIAEKLQLHRDSVFNKSNFFPDYVELCKVGYEDGIPLKSRIITSDDVFDYMLNIRNLNEGIDEKRKELFQDYLNTKYQKFQFRSLDDYEQLKKVNRVRSTTQSKYVRSEVMDNVREYSNGESAFRYFAEKIEEDGLYLLDEPENSLSPENQLKLKRLIEDSVRYFGCQFIISTHSPFLLSMKGAKIYDMDENPVDLKRWTEVKNVKTYFEFFEEHRNEFI